MGCPGAGERRESRPWFSRRADARTRNRSARTHEGTSIANWTICEAVRYFFHHTLRPSVATCEEATREFASSPKGFSFKARSPEAEREKGKLRRPLAHRVVVVHGHVHEEVQDDRDPLARAVVVQLAPAEHEGAARGVGKEARGGGSARSPGCRALQPITRARRCSAGALEQHARSLQSPFSSFPAAPTSVIPQARTQQAASHPGLAQPTPTHCQLSESGRGWLRRDDPPGVVVHVENSDGPAPEHEERRVEELVVLREVVDVIEEDEAALVELGGLLVAPDAHEALRGSGRGRLSDCVAVVGRKWEGFAPGRARGPGAALHH